MADYVSFQPNLPSFGSDYLAQGFAGALALPNYFQNVDRQGELWKYAQEMQPLDKRNKELSNEQMSLTNQGLQHGMSEKQLSDVLNKALLANPDYTQMAVNNSLAGLVAGQAESANKASTNQADAGYQIATQIKDWPETVRRQFVEKTAGYTLPKDIAESIIKDPSKYKQSYEANAPYARQYGLESLQGMWGAKTASAGRDRPLPPMNMSQIEAELSKKVTTGTATPVEVAELERIRANKYATADIKEAQRTAVVIKTLKEAGRQYIHPETGQKVRFDRLPLGTQQDLINRELSKPSGSGQPQVSKPGIQTSKGGLPFTVKQSGN